MPQGEPHAGERPDMSPGWTAAEHGQCSVAVATEVEELLFMLAVSADERPGTRRPSILRARAPDSPVPGEGESGCLFDEINNFVEPIERSAKGERPDRA